MKRTLKQRATILPALAASLCVGIILGWLLRSWGAPRPAVLDASRPDAPTASYDTTSVPSSALGGTSGGATHEVATTGEPLVAPVPPLLAAGVIGGLRQHGLRLPIDGASVDGMKGGFDERRDAGGRPHEAADIPAPRNTPVYAVEDGAIAKLFFSKAGGNTIYQFDPTGRFCYYYAHLERYVSGLHDGQHVSRGEIIGYVGTSGNAPANTPHLHFAVFELDADRHWWKGRPLDPYLIFKP